MNSQGILIVIVGPTAVGKTALSLELAKRFSAEIFSADSRQFYREISIGTAKPNADELAQVKHHFINSLSIQEQYNASKFAEDVLNKLETYFNQKHLAILCGGSGMYVNALCDGFDDDLPSQNEALRKEYESLLKERGIEELQMRLKAIDPVYYEEVDLSNSKRLMRALEVSETSGKPYSELRKGNKKSRPFKIIKIGLDKERTELYHTINQRVDQMVNMGLEEEVRSVMEYRSHNALKTVGYREFFDYFDDEMTYEKTIEKIKVNSRRYAKRQLTWFKKDSEIKWFKAEENKEIIQYLRKRINSNE